MERLRLSGHNAPTKYGLRQHTAWRLSVKTGDLVVATRKEIRPTAPRNRYFGIFLKEKYGDLFIKWIGGAGIGRFSPDFWDVEVVSENR